MKFLDRQRIHHLAAETLGDDAGTNALAGGVNGRCRTGRTAADDEHIEGFLIGDLGGGAGRCTGVESGDDFLDAHPALAEFFAVQIDRRDGHDLALVHLVLEHRTVDHRACHTRIEHGHQIERLHDVRAVMAGQRDEGFKVEAAGQGLDLLDHRGIDLRRVAAGLQQGEDQRGELMAHRNAGKVDARRFARLADGERGAQRGLAVFAQADLRRKFGNVDQHGAHFLRLVAVVQGGNDFDRALQFFEIGLELGLDVGVEHGGSPLAEFH